VLGVRPEHSSLHDPACPSERRNAAALPAVVDLVEPTGVETMVGLKMAGRDVMARFEADQTPEPGQAISVALDTSRACVFDAESEWLEG